MVITVRHLRRIISEEIRRSLSETPLGDVFPTVASRLTPDEEEDSMFGGRDGSEEKERAVSRFHSAPKYRSDAKKLFRLWDIDVYIQPLFSQTKWELGLEIGSVRSSLMGPKKGLAFLEKRAGWSKEKVDDTKAKLAAGSLVIVSAASGLQKDFLPSPWMIIHAFWDSIEARQGIPAEVDEAYEDLMRYIVDNFSFPGRDRYSKLKSCMTMGSARTGKLGDDNDITAELLTQAATSSRGVTFKQIPGDDKFNLMLDDLKSYIDNMNVRGMMQEALKGKVLLIASEFSEEAD